MNTDKADTAPDQEPAPAGSDRRLSRTGIFGKVTAWVDAVNRFSPGWTAAVVWGLSLAAYYLHSRAFPLRPGRDFATYLTYYADFWNSEPVYHFLMLYRTPLAPFVLGGSLSLGGVRGLEAVFALFYATSLTAVFLVARRLWNNAFGVLAAVMVLVYPAYGMLYHQAASNVIFSTAFMLWCVAIAETYARPSTRAFVLHGLFVSTLVLIRPSSQVFLIFAAFPFCLRGVAFPERVKYALGFFGVCVVLLLAWCVHNGVRYDDFTVSRGKGALMPLYRLFVYDKIIHPENGPNSRELDRAIRTDLLRKEPYRSYGITPEQFYGAPSSYRLWADLVGLSDRTWGWDSDYRKLFAVSVEAVRNYPAVYVRNTLGNGYQVFTSHLSLPLPGKRHGRRKTAPPSREGAGGAPPGLEVPSEGQIVPRSYMDCADSSPDNRLAPDPHSLERKYSPEQMRKINRLAERVKKIPALTVTKGNRDLAGMYARQLARYPKMLFWLLLGLAGLFFCTTDQRRLLLTYFALSLTLLGVTYAGVPSIIQYRVPFDPIFIASGCLALLNIGGRLAALRQKTARRSPRGADSGRH